MHVLSTTLLGPNSQLFQCSIKNGAENAKIHVHHQILQAD